MGDATLTTDLGRVLVTGGSGFVGANLATELLDRGHEVRSFDRAPSPLPAHPRLHVEGDICDPATVAAAVDGIDTIFHTAAIIDLMGGPSVTDEYRQRSFAVNVGGTENLVHAAQAAAGVTPAQVLAENRPNGTENRARPAPDLPQSPRWSGADGSETVPRSAAKAHETYEETGPIMSFPTHFVSGTPSPRLWDVVDVEIERATGEVWSETATLRVPGGLLYRLVARTGASLFFVPVPEPDRRAENAPTS